MLINNIDSKALVIMIIIIMIIIILIVYCCYYTRIMMILIKCCIFMKKYKTKVQVSKIKIQVCALFTHKMAVRCVFWFKFYDP